MLKINSIQNMDTIKNIESINSDNKPLNKEKVSQNNAFDELLKRVVDSEAQAEVVSNKYATGSTQNIHETMITLEKANINFKLLVSVRNKILDAYREISRMS